MPNYRRFQVQSACYFFTVATHQRQAILTDELFRRALHQAVKKVRDQYPFIIDAWVLLPDHLHCIWTLPVENTNYSLRWGLIKGLVTKSIGQQYFRADLLSDSRWRCGESTIWQRRFWEHQIRNQADYSARMDYVHINPLKHGLVGQVKDWPWSTFHRLVREGVYPENWAGSGDNFLFDFDK
ncbi:MAG: REP-associated tyrosine transposase [Iodobacter sp.]